MDDQNDFAPGDVVGGRSSNRTESFDIELESALHGAIYPLQRRELLLVARENDAPSWLLTYLSGLPDLVFRSYGEVSERMVATPLS
jgi:hypothetical protein